MSRLYSRYAGCCVNSDANSIHNMVDAARDVTYETVARHVPLDLIAEVFPFYAWGPGKPGELRLKDDWAVSYHKSTYRRRPCYYIRHSAIEYIFTRP
jgi:hypothetical protein